MKRSILIVEDVEAIAKMIEEILSGWEVFFAQTGKEAIEKYRELKPDILTMDIVMPDMNGISAIKEVKRFDPDAKIIVISAIDTPDVMKEAIEAGVSDYIVKPFSPKKLKKTIESVLSG
ncbi:MAG: response regulator [Candidatus Syntropharchaeia archaeon]